MRILTPLVLFLGLLTAAPAFAGAKYVVCEDIHNLFVTLDKVDTVVGALTLDDTLLEPGCRRTSLAAHEYYEHPDWWYHANAGRFLSNTLSQTDMFFDISRIVRVDAAGAEVVEFAMTRAAVASDTTNFARFSAFIEQCTETRSTWDGCMTYRTLAFYDFPF